MSPVRTLSVSAQSTLRSILAAYQHKMESVPCITSLGMRFRDSKCVVYVAVKYADLLRGNYIVQPHTLSEWAVYFWFR